MLRLNTTWQREGEVVVVVEGRVADGDVALLDREIARHVAWAGRIELDFDGVRFIDEAGLEVLQGWRRKGVVLRGGSSFVRALLETRGLV